MSRPDWPEPQAVQPLFDVVKRARAALRAKDFVELNESTKADYARKAHRLRAHVALTKPQAGFTRLEAYFARHAPISNTFFAHLAILDRSLTDEVRARLSQQDKYQRLGDFQLWRDRVKDLERQLDFLDELRKLDRTDLLRRTGQASRKVRSKGGLVESLDDDWIERLLERSASSKFYWAILTLAVSGCRPAEVNGTRLTYKNGKIEITIKGKKVTEENGQKWRKFLISPDQIPDKALEELKECKTMELDGLETEKQRNVLRSYLRKLGKELFPDLELKISPIVFRHFMAYELRQSGWDKEGIGSVLGHASENTQAKYGGRRKSGSIKNKARVEKGSVEKDRPLRKARTSAFLSDSPPNLGSRRRTSRKPK